MSAWSKEQGWNPGCTRIKCPAHSRNLNETPGGREHARQAQETRAPQSEESRLRSARLCLRYRLDMPNSWKSVLALRAAKGAFCRMQSSPVREHVREALPSIGSFFALPGSLQTGFAATGHRACAEIGPPTACNHTSLSTHPLEEEGNGSRI